MCAECLNTGWVGDNGPGQRGNREYAPCDCRAKMPAMTTSADDPVGSVLYPSSCGACRTCYRAGFAVWNLSLTASVLECL